MANDHILTAELIADRALPSDPQLSPDGRRVAFTVQATTKTKDQKAPRAAIWVAPADGSAPARRWTGYEAHERMPRWSPDGRSLAFLSDRAAAGQAQLFLMPATGGEAEQLTRRKGGVNAFAWSPDGASLAFTAADEERADESKRREESGDDVQVWGERLRLARLHLRHADGSITTISPADRSVGEFAWAPSGREIAAALAVRPDLEAPAEAGVDLVLLPVAGGPPRTVCHVPFGLSHLTWSADGGALLFTAWEAGTIPSSRAIFSVPAAGGTPRCLTTGLQGCLLSLVRPERCWTLLCTVAEGLTTRLYTLDPASGGLQLRCEPHTGVAGSELSTDRDGRALALVVSAWNEPAEIWCGTSSGDLRRVSNANPAYRGLRWARQEPFAWTAPDGLALDGVILRPLDATAQPPGVVLVHGGPYARTTMGFNSAPLAWAQWLALDGCAVFLPNPRGGMGHGHAFAATVAGEVGMADWQDVLSGTEAFVRAGHTDGARLGIGGWSQGGFMTAWAVSGGAPANGPRCWDGEYRHWNPAGGDRFRAGVMGAGVSDWGAMWSESDVPTFEAMLGGSRPSDGV
ncbi:MAG TPA: prolyl oligopeptidase family serine peptidase, partial [Dehalococcoidia bacterium]|nr:prolyl oligopeptidase family serine peptidase [Dehalococcoidia bacterium]